MGPWAHGRMGPMGPMGPWAHGPIGLNRSRIDPGSILDRSWIDPGSIQAHGPMGPIWTPYGAPYGPHMGPHMGPIWGGVIKLKDPLLRNTPSNLGS